MSFIVLLLLSCCFVAVFLLFCCCFVAAFVAVDRFDLELIALFLLVLLEPETDWADGMVLGRCNGWSYAYT